MYIVEMSESHKNVIVSPTLLLYLLPCCISYFVIASPTLLLCLLLFHTRDVFYLQLNTT